MPENEALTRLLNAAQCGDADAARSAYELVYAELKRRARNSLRSARPDDTMTPTALVHEVYLRFNDSTAQPLRDRSHFYALAARAMRQILVDHARRRCADKRGGGARATVLDHASRCIPAMSCARSNSIAPCARSNCAIQTSPAWSNGIFSPA
jgi:RNA polymerase sigma factor (TIGR02999 family)